MSVAASGSDIVIYIVIGVLSFIIGIIAGYLLLSSYYSRRFFVVGKACSEADSLVPLIMELEKES